MSWNPFGSWSNFKPIDDLRDTRRSPCRPLGFFSLCPRPDSAGQCDNGAAGFDVDPFRIELRAANQRSFDVGLDLVFFDGATSRLHNNQIRHADHALDAAGG